MEYLSRGCLLDWFEKLGKLKFEKEPDLRIPNQVLWDMMACCKLAPLITRVARSVLTVGI